MTYKIRCRVNPAPFSKRRLKCCRVPKSDCAQMHEILVKTLKLRQRVQQAYIDSFEDVGG